MDPNAVLALLHEALDDDDLVEARDALAILDGWLAGGGFLPTNWDTNRSRGMYGIHATYEQELPDGAVRSGQIPTFFLDSRVQGILNESSARQIALDVLQSGADNTVTFHVSAVQL